ncbi:MAG: hypothetical protein HYX25_07985 [Candidatus Solibacter usitatus]|nr:hypothetical protein [Candidatus Solibacter usitatus]
MNVKKTIEFLLEHQARAEVRMDKIDKRLDGITKLMRMGAKAMLATDKKVAALTEKFDALIESEQRTDRALAATNKKFDRLIETLSKKGANGRHN